LVCGCGSSRAGSVPANGGGSQGGSGALSDGGARSDGGAPSDGGESQGGDSPSNGGSDATGGASSCSHGNIELFATQVSGTVTVNGAPFTAPLDTEKGDLVLRNAANDYAPLTTIADGDGSYSALIAPGTYDLYYQHTGQSVVLAGNDSALLQSGIVVGTEPLSLDIDIPVGTVSGTLTIAGRVFIDPSGKDLGAIELSSATSRRVLLGTTLPNDGRYSALVIAGTYDAFYLGGASVAIPRNYFTQVRKGVVVSGGKTLSLDFDVPDTTVAVSLTVNGAPATNQAQLVLRHASDQDSDQVVLDQTGPGKNTHSAHVIPGNRYDLYYTGLESGPNALLNSKAVIKTGIDIGTAPVSLNVDVAATVVSGKVTLNGAPLSLTDGTGFYLKTAAGDQVPLLAPDGTYSAVVVPGTYDMYFDGGSAGIADFPNSTIELRSGVVIGASPVSLDVQIPEPTPVSGKITVAGDPITGNPPWLTLSDGTTIASAPSGNTYSALAFPGTYDLIFHAPQDAGNLPSNYSARIKTGVVVGTSPLVLDIDIPRATLSGTITLNGALKGDAELDGGYFIIRFPDKSGQTRIGSPVGVAGTYTSFLVPGRYELSYSTNGSGHGLPSNHNLSLGCLIVE